MVTETRELHAIVSKLQSSQLSPTAARRAERVIRRLESFCGLIRKNNPAYVIWSAAFGPGVVWLVKGPYERLLRSQNVEILVVVRGSYFEANKALSKSVFGPLLLKEEWLPRYHVWTQDELREAKARQHPVWVRLHKGFIECYGSRQLQE